MISTRVKSNLRREWKQNHLAKFGAVIITMFIIVLIFAPVLAPHDPLEQDLGRRLIPPFQTWQHPLGTDALGRDMLSRILYGIRISATVGIASISIATVMGVGIGLTAGYMGGRLDEFLMRITDIAITIPSIMIAITMYGLVGAWQIRVPDPFVTLSIVSSNKPETFILPGTVIFAIAFVSWTQFARVARGEALSLKKENYVVASKSIGASDYEIIIRHILPNSVSPILVLATMRIGYAILLESALAFLGFSGANVSLGRDVALGRAYLATSWWVAILPGFAIILIVIGVNLLGDLLRDAFDPNLESESGQI